MLVTKTPTVKIYNSSTKKIQQAYHTCKEGVLVRFYGILYNSTHSMIAKKVKVLSNDISDNVDVKFFENL